MGFRTIKTKSNQGHFFLHWEKHRKSTRYLFKKIITEGHSVGNHTFNHLNGWKTSTKDYLKNIELCKKASLQTQSNNLNLEFENWELGTGNWELFRPPYGKITPTQTKKIRKLGYKIIMWDVLNCRF